MRITACACALTGFLYLGCSGIDSLEDGTTLADVITTPDAVFSPDVSVPDGGDTGGEGTVPSPAGTLLYTTAGGGAGSSSGYSVRLGFGAPQPVGAASSDTHHVRTGPTAGGH